MQKFTRALTREIEVGSERLAITFDEKGITLRPVGSRRPPHTLSWAGLLCACTSPSAGSEPGSDTVQAALQTLRAGASKEKEKPQPAAETAPSHPSPAPSPASTAPTATEPALADLLARVDHWFQTHRHRYREAMRPGASAADCDHLQHELGVPLPAELRTWLGWHNGQGEDYVGAFEESWNLMSTQEIAEAKKQLDTQSHPGWKRDWVPFLTDDHDNYLCLDSGQAGGPVRACWRGQEEHPVVAPSLHAWAEGFLTALERGSYHEDPERGTFFRREGA